MSDETPAERHEKLVRRGIERYREVFIRLFVYLAQGGRVPGMAKMTEEDLRAAFRATPPEVWQQIAARDPAMAARLLREFSNAEAPPLPAPVPETVL